MNAAQREAIRLLEKMKDGEISFYGKPLFKFRIKKGNVVIIWDDVYQNLEIIKKWWIIPISMIDISFDYSSAAVFHQFYAELQSEVERQESLKKSKYAEKLANKIKKL